MENILKKYKLEIFFTLLSLGLFIYSILYGTPNKIMDLKRLQNTTKTVYKCLKTTDLNNYRTKLTEFENVLTSTINSDSNYNNLSTNIESIKTLIRDNDCTNNNKCKNINNDYIWKVDNCSCPSEKPVLSNVTLSCMTQAAAKAAAAAAKAAAAVTESDTLLTTINGALVQINN